ncbi:hypothetical protein GCM10018952_49960 [Streptosporangium vulgare]
MCAPRWKGLSGLTEGLASFWDRSVRWFRHRHGRKARLRRNLAQSVFKHILLPFTGNPKGVEPAKGGAEFQLDLGQAERPTERRNRPGQVIASTLPKQPTPDNRTAQRRLPPNHRGRSLSWCS